MSPKSARFWLKNARFWLNARAYQPLLACRAREFRNALIMRGFLTVYHQALHPAEPVPHAYQLDGPWDRYAHHIGRPREREQLWNMHNPKFTGVTRMAYSPSLWLMAIGWWNKINQCRKLKLNLTQTWAVCMSLDSGMHWSQNQWYCDDKLRKE